MNLSKEDIEKVTLRLNGNSSNIKSVYCIGPMKKSHQNDYFNNDIGKILDAKALAIALDGRIHFNNQGLGKCFYHNKFCNIDFALDFTEIKTVEEERIFLVSNIECIENKKAILWLGGKNARIKVWINNQIIFNGISSFINSELILMELTKGDNLVFIELGRIMNGLELLKVSLKVADFDWYVNEPEYAIVQSYINRDVVGKVQVIQEGWEIKGGRYQFTIIPRDFNNILQTEKIKISIKDSGGNICNNIIASIGHSTEMAFDKMQQGLKGNNLLTMEVEYLIKSGEKATYINLLIIGDADGQMQVIKNKFNDLRKNCQISDDYIDAIERRIENAESIISELKSLYKFPVILIQLFKKTVDELFIIFMNLTEGNAYKDFNENGKIKYVYYKSKLDNQAERYTVILPENYSSDKEYPLVIFLPGNRYDDDVMLSQSEIDYGDVILVEISCKGMTFGSYIGEAAFMEVWDLVRDTYSIDEDRVYLTGICSGAYAAWALAQAYPSLFAAMMVSGGGPFVKNLNNLNNIKIKNICSDEIENIEKFYSVPTKILTKLNDDYQAILFNELRQNTLNFILCRSSYALEWLLQYKKEKQPQIIFYRTDRIRHNKAYWIEITKMDAGKRYCKLEGERVDNNRIKLSLMNISAFILKIPHMINKSNMVIEINESQTLYLKCNNEDYLYFKKARNEYLLVTKTEIEMDKGGSLGLGILDIYMDRLKIVIPLNFKSEKEENLIKGIAKAFSNPMTTGINPQIYINYPVISSEQVSNQDIESCNLLLIGQVYVGLLSKIKDSLRLEFDDNGFTYKGIRKRGNYCIMMIHANPMNKNKKVLYIYANDIKLLRNIFTRKVIIPTYFNGLHPQLNSEVILLEDEEYYLIYSMGDDIQRA